jgi:hypothetical protein
MRSAVYILSGRLCHCLIELSFAIIYLCGIFVYLHAGAVELVSMYFAVADILNPGVKSLKKNPLSVAIIVSKTFPAADNAQSFPKQYLDFVVYSRGGLGAAVGGFT